jgi:AcrR family transcriptional regulator
MWQTLHKSNHGYVKDGAFKDAKVRPIHDHRSSKRRAQGDPMNAQSTRRQILDAAQRLIETAGVMRLTTKEIAREARCAEGTLFNHFKRKEDLCVAVVLENAPRFKETIARKQPGRRTVAKNLEDIALAAVRFSEKLIPLGVMLLADTKLLARHRRGMEGQGSGPKEVFDLIAAYVEGERRLGRIRQPVDPLSVAALLFGPCFHWAFVRQAMGKNLFPMRDQQFVVGLVATLMHGLSPMTESTTTGKVARSKAKNTGATQ